MRIIGIDPGTKIVGYAVVEPVGSRIKAIAYGAIRAGNKVELPERLRVIYRELRKVFKKYPSDETVIETVFFNKDAQAAIKIGEGRGVALLCAAEAKQAIFEYTPAEIKKSVTGNGRADKKQIQEMVKVILGLEEIPRPADAADALAIAICHIHRRKN